MTTIHREQISMLTSPPQSLEEALQGTADSLNAYGEQFEDWAIAYSGGKDSSATITAVVHQWQEVGLMQKTLPFGDEE